ncbi:unnamed protein product, partial [Prorocentrum cordatum]
DSHSDAVKAQFLFNKSQAGDCFKGALVTSRAFMTPPMHSIPSTSLNYSKQSSYLYGLKMQSSHEKEFNEPPSPSTMRLAAAHDQNLVDDLVYMLTAQSPVTGDETQLKVTGFVDDLADKFLAPNTATARTAGVAQNKMIDAGLNNIGTHQNISKQVNIYYGVGKGSYSDAIQINNGCILQGKTTTVARYLGPRLTNTFTMTAEIEQRIIAVERGWSQLRKFWTSDTPFRLRLNIFKCQVLNSALSGLEVWARKYTPLRKSDLADIESRVVKYGRVLLNGTASYDDDHVRQIPSVYVLHKLQVAPLFVELRIRRIKWMQQMARTPQVSVQPLAALFGHMSFEKEPTI